MEDERRPRASAWQIAGVWIAAAMMGLDMWQLAGSIDQGAALRAPLRSPMSRHFGP
ncbi:hypothetical protein [Arthrobacter bambusae]|uniref:Uncharacterized protein n=1 Tax=Arthrobacter bambusae TaxID=1338426 RepID=A0AAW8D548_9MICC|nr:hypothetical protein [Arthrobacter bambusae]MDP9903247.1 hypothetical protein [Arthrobacter bambusae]MDQ0128759.1 hypothetical protein [Arthrobacter bambusae]MDQ0180100.1 hypothetical protein [Arthrobacter bambusae]